MEGLVITVGSPVARPVLMGSTTSAAVDPQKSPASPVLTRPALETTGSPTLALHSLAPSYRLTAADLQQQAVSCWSHQHSSRYLYILLLTVSIQVLVALHQSKLCVHIPTKKLEQQGTLILSCLPTAPRLLAAVLSLLCVPLLPMATTTVWCSTATLPTGTLSLIARWQHALCLPAQLGST